MRATAIGGCALLVTQSALHLIATLGFHSTDSLVDLDRSNGIPDIVSVAIILSAALAAAVLATHAGDTRLWAMALVIALTFIAIDDTLHEETNVSTTYGRIVVATILAAALLTISVAVKTPRPARTILLVALTLLAIDVKIPFIYDQLMNVTGNPALVRGDLLDELGVVLDENIETAAWILLSIGLWAATFSTPEAGPEPGAATSAPLTDSAARRPVSR